jgi:plastocyanin
MPPVQLPARRALSGALLAAAIVLATGCSDDAPVREDQPVVRVTLDEYAITPQDISVPSGRVELVARNIGRLTHNLQIEVPPKDPDAQTETLGETPTAQPGTTVDATVDLKPGTYLMRCSLANHDDLGMTGTLVVRKRDASG